MLANKFSVTKLPIPKFQSRLHLSTTSNIPKCQLSKDVPTQIQKHKVHQRSTLTFAYCKNLLQTATHQSLSLHKQFSTKNIQPTSSNLAKPVKDRKQANDLEATTTSTEPLIEKPFEKLVLETRQSPVTIDTYVIYGNGTFQLPNLSKPDLTSTKGEYTGPFRFVSNKGVGTLYVSDNNSQPLAKTNIELKRTFAGTFKSFHGSGKGFLEIEKLLNGETQFNDGKISGACIIQYTNGTKFQGEWQDLEWKKGKMQIGKLISYEGEFKNGEFDGEGVYVMHDGSRYAGQFQNGLFHGKGKLTSHNGITFEGTFKNGKRFGHGELVDPIRKLTYKGEFDDNEYGGFGVLQSPTFTYEGYMKFGEFNGQGKLKQNDGIEYDGNWNMGKRSGLGTAKFANGSTYTGNFENDKIEGSGKFYFADKQMSIEAVWTSPNATDFASKSTTKSYSSSRPIGNVKVETPNYTYEGNMENGRVTGKGKMRHNNGIFYEGMFLNEKYHGQGKLITEEGVVFEGLFKDGKFIDGVADYSQSSPKDMRVGWREGAAAIFVVVWLAAVAWVFKNYYDKQNRQATEKNNDEAIQQQQQQEKQPTQNNLNQSVSSSSQTQISHSNDYQPTISITPSNLKKTETPIQNQTQSSHPPSHQPHNQQKREATIVDSIANIFKK